MNAVALSSSQSGNSPKTPQSEDKQNKSSIWRDAQAEKLLPSPENLVIYHLVFLQFSVSFSHVVSPGTVTAINVFFSSGDISVVLSLMDEILWAGWSSSCLGDFHALILNRRVKAQLCSPMHGALVAQTLNNVRPPGFSTYVPRLLVQNFGARLAVYWMKYSKEVN